MAASLAYSSVSLGRIPCVTVSDVIDADEVSKLVWAAERGDLDRLQCPECREPAVSVTFTHPAEDAYRVYFTCTVCSFSMSASRRGKPSYFSDDRVDPT